MARKYILSLTPTEVNSSNVARTNLFGVDTLTVEFTDAQRDLFITLANLISAGAADDRVATMIDTVYNSGTPYAFTNVTAAKLALILEGVNNSDLSAITVSAANVKTALEAIV